MTLDQLRKFANSSDGWVKQIALTKDAARQLIAEHEREIGHQDRGFDIPVRRSAGHDAMEVARIDRLREVDERVEAELFEAAL
jgi:hypothetical protein